MRLVTYRATAEAEARLGALVGAGTTLVLDLARFGAARGWNCPRACSI
ncbi:hypothetical protein ACFS32_04330 [Novosphingobium pokkalii]